MYVCEQKRENIFETVYNLTEEAVPMKCVPDCKESVDLQ